jgi:hypothetical protein
MTWKELAAFAAQVPPDFADKPVVGYLLAGEGIGPSLGPVPLVIQAGSLDDRGPSLAVDFSGA